MNKDLLGEKTMAAPEVRLGLVRVVQGCSKLSNEVHLLPCCVNHNGPAPVSDYFRPKSTGSSTEGIEVKTAFFRGRKLLGSTLELPQGYCGLFLEKDVTQSCKDTKKKYASGDKPDIWNTKSIFKDMNYWQHDENPSSVDDVPRAMEWLQLAAVMHRPVSSAEVASMQKNGFLKENSLGPKRKCAEI